MLGVPIVYNVGLCGDRGNLYVLEGMSHVRSVVEVGYGQLLTHVTCMVEVDTLHMVC